jgi:hypothetical protein
MPMHRELLTKLLHGAEILLADAEHLLQSAQPDVESCGDWHQHHRLAKSNVARIRNLLNVGDSSWQVGGQV